MFRSFKAVLFDATQRIEEFTFGIRRRTRNGATGRKGRAGGRRSRRRIAGKLAGCDVMFMASHGVTVSGSSVAWTFDDLYYLERTCMHQVLAVQAAGGGRLRRIPDELCAKVATQIAGERQQSDLYFESIKRMLDRDEPGWRKL
jgi:ribulose-5-phosphate 4-epimerase/fuculose-1-phosphate aldolase